MHPEEPPRSRATTPKQSKLGSQRYATLFTLRSFFFESAPLSGYRGGIVSITLGASCPQIGPLCELRGEAPITAYLKCSVQAAVNLQLILLEAGQLHDGQNLVALLKDVEGGNGPWPAVWFEATRYRCGLQALSLEIKKGVERIGVCCVHDRTQVLGDFENGKPSRPTRPPIWFTT
jgi:hypothetical protein